MENLANMAPLDLALLGVLEGASKILINDCQNQINLKMI